MIVKSSMARTLVDFSLIINNHPCKPMANFIKKLVEGGGGGGRLLRHKSSKCHLPGR